jgi:hypothetical protein
MHLAWSGTRLVDQEELVGEFRTDAQEKVAVKHLPGSTDSMDTSRYWLLVIFALSSSMRHGEQGSTQLCFFMSTFG